MQDFQVRDFRRKNFARKLPNNALKMPQTTRVDRG
jgi:hypothetical protein